MTQDQLNTLLATPSQALIEDFGKLDGDVLVLGAGGKMGPTLCLLAANARTAAGKSHKIIAVSRYSDPAVPTLLREGGVEVIQADLMDDAALEALPRAKYVVYMAGLKFGTSGNPAPTWAMNVYLPGRVAQHFRDSNIVVFSSGNIYPQMPLHTGGAVEDTTLVPNGEYAITVLGRERLFDYYGHKFNTPMAFYRLNYAVDLRYGVFHDIASTIMAGDPVDVSMGCFNCIWQGDANEWALRMMFHCKAPVEAYNVTGPERVIIREAALALGKMLGKPVQFKGEEGERALLSNSTKCISMFGYPRVGVQQMMQMTADWILQGGSSLGKPTHFEATDGKY